MFKTLKLIVLALSVAIDIMSSLTRGLLHGLLPAYTYWEGFASKHFTVKYSVQYILN